MYQNSWWNDLQFLRCRVWQTEIGNYESSFSFYLPPENLKYQKTAGDIIILLMCTKSYEVQFLRHGARQNFLSFWAIFWPPTPPPPPITPQNHNNLENQNLKKKKNPWYWPRKLKFGKKVKNTWRCYPFTHVYHKLRSDVWFLRYKMW